MRRRLRIWNVFDLAPPLLLALAGAFFCVGLLAGFLLSAHLDGAVSAEQVGLLPAAVTRLRLWSAFWSNYRWLLLSGVLALSALGVFLLYPLVLLRGFVLGFSFTTLFGARKPGYCADSFPADCSADLRPAAAACRIWDAAGTVGTAQAAVRAELFLGQRWRFGGADAFCRCADCPVLCASTLVPARPVGACLS